MRGSGYSREVSQRSKASIVDKRRREIWSLQATKGHGGRREQVFAVVIVHFAEAEKSCAQMLD